MIKKVPLYLAKKICYNIPPLKNFYSDHYATYRFLACNLKHRLNILRPEAYVQWLATYNCNFRCKHCEASACGREVPELTTNEVMGLMTELARMKVKKIIISGGEPLVRKDIFKIIRHISDKGMRYGMASNGFLVSRFKNEFSSLTPSMFFTSIDGLQETNDEIRGMKGAFENSLQALEFFRSIGTKDRIINTVVFPGNFEELTELKKFVLESGATFWRLALTIPVGRARENEKMFLNNRQMKSLFDFIENTRKEFDIELTEDAGYLGCLNLRLRSRPFFCTAGLTSCSVMPDGEVLGCQIAYDNRYSEGNVRHKSFKTIWQNGFSRFRNPQFEKECLNCRYLNGCRGGCWGMRLGNRHCLKEVWREKKC